MLKRIRYHFRTGLHGRLYSCRGTTLYKPFRLLRFTLDIREEHLAFLDGSRIPLTDEERRIHSLLIHENVHSDRQAAHWAWELRYRWSRTFRLNEEKLAYHAQLAQLARYGIPINFTWFAAILSGRAYGHMIEFDEAYRWVRHVVTTEGDITVMFDSMAVDQDFKKLLKSQNVNAQINEWLAVYHQHAPLGRNAWIWDRLSLIGVALLFFFLEFAAIWWFGR